MRFALALTALPRFSIAAACFLCPLTPNSCLFFFLFSNFFLNRSALASRVFFLFLPRSTRSLSAFSFLAAPLCFFSLECFSCLDLCSLPFTSLVLRALAAVSLAVNSRIRFACFTLISLLRFSLLDVSLDFF